MPINVGYFSIRQPRVSRINAQTTLPPSSSGTFSLKDGFTITYSGSASTCYLYVTGTSVLTLCDEDYTHPDNLNIPMIGMTIEEIAEEINNQNNYSTNLITTTLEDLAYLEGAERIDISSSSHLVRYNTEKEYLIDVHTPGKINEATINTKTEQFSFEGQLSRWMVDEGYIHDEIDVALDGSGKASVGQEGVFIDFEPSYNPDAPDLSNIVVFEDIELVRALDQPINSTTFQAAPILIDGTLELKINQQVATEGQDYIVDYGTFPTIVAANQDPYTFNNSNNVLEVRWNSDPLQTFVIPSGTYTASEVASIVNQTATGFEAIGVTDDQRQSFFVLQGLRGTKYHQVRVEQGSANSVFGFDDFQAKKGEGSGQLIFMTYVAGEDLTPELETDNFIVSASTKFTDNPFLGVDVANFRFIVDGEELIKGQDFLVNQAGFINLINIVESESLVGATLKLDNELFPPDYYIYEDGVPLVEGEDYTINRQGGWITLEESAFPGRVYSATYTNRVIGIIENEIILGGQGKLTGSESGPYSINSSNNTFIVSVNNGADQIFTFEQNLGTSVDNVVSIINDTAVGFKASNVRQKIVLTTLDSGPNYTLKIGSGTANTEFGFTENQSAAGFGAEGGERSLDVKNAPIDKTGFTAPIDGDTIIIKNNDVLSRYPRGAVLKMQQDYYQVENSVLEERANLISSTPGPYTILSDTNDTFIFSIDGEDPITITFNEGVEIDIATIVSQINSARPLTARILLINGQQKIQLLGDTSVSIGNGTSNRTIGFDDGSEDTNIPDTYIKIVGLFRTTYVSPDLFTTINPIEFVDVTSIRLEVPQNTSEVLFVGDLTDTYLPNIFMRVGGLYYYRILNSSFENGITTVTLHNKLDIPIFEDTSIGISTLAIYEEGDVNIRTKYLPILTQPYALRKNGDLLIVDEDYSIAETGDIELLTDGLKFGDEFIIDYTSRVFVEEGTPLTAIYSYFDFLRKGTNLKISLQGINPDNFFINVLHGSTILARTTDDLIERTQNNLNSSSSGFPTGEIPVTPNDESGSATFNYNIGDLDDKIEVSKKVFEFYDQRLQYFEEERQAINGAIVGAEDGRVTISQIEDSASLPAPQRLFPIPDNRPAEELTEPVRVPALDGLNQNDAGSSASGTASSYLNLEYSKELPNLQEEKTKLQTLLTRSTTSDSITSAGTYTVTTDEIMSMYVEINNGGLQQRNVSVTFTAALMDENDYADEINLAVNAAFGVSVNPATVSGGNIVLTVNNSGTKARCIYITTDVPSVNFGTGSEASLRSRATLYTSGATYILTVPGGDSVHQDINDHQGDRVLADARHSDQLDNLDGQLREWLAPYDDAFAKAKAEKTRVDTAVTESADFTALSTAFQNSKFGVNELNSIDSNITINDRIAEIDARIVEINRRTTELNNRLTEISDTLNTEGLYNPRFSWVILLADKSSGFYASKQIEITQEERRQREAANNAQAVQSLGGLT